MLNQIFFQKTFENVNNLEDPFQKYENSIQSDNAMLWLFRGGYLDDNLASSIDYSFDAVFKNNVREWRDWLVMGWPSLKLQETLLVN